MDVRNYINGKFQAAHSGKTLANIDPAMGKSYGTLPDSDEHDVQEAIAASSAARISWARKPSEERAGFLFRMADDIEKNLVVFARAESKDTGKPFSLAKRVDIPRAVKNLRFFASAIAHVSDDSFATDMIALNYTLRQPLGVVACITPWNLPLYLLTWKLGPALAVGNTVVAKPSEITPVTAYMLCETAQRVGLPPGVLNIVHGLGDKVGAPLCASTSVKGISFTGGTKTGKSIAVSVAPQLKKISLELGGKNPVLVFDSCDFENAISESVRAAFTNQGEICLCGSRIFVQKTIYAEFKKAFVEKVSRLNVGHPDAEATNLGALISEAHMQKVLSYITLAKEEGGTILCGGNQARVASCENGYFVEPTVIEGLSADCRVNREEIFGPVCTLIPFDTEEEALRMANCTEYGLASVIFTRDLDQAHRVARHVESGIVWVNTWMLRDLRTPFGGVKSSGLGREGGLEALRFFTEEKNICIALKEGLHV